MPVIDYTEARAELERLFAVAEERFRADPTPHAARADVFSRTSRPGWDAWGNEMGKFDV